MNEKRFSWRRLRAALLPAADLRRGRLAPRLILLCLVAAILPLVVAASVGGQSATRVLRQQAESNLEGYSASVAGQIEAALADRLKDARVLASDPAVVRYLATPPDQRAAVQDAAWSAVQRFVTSDPSYTIGFLLSDAGIVQLSTDAALYARPDLSFRTYFKEAIAGRPNVSDVSMGVNVQSTPAMFFTAPVRNEAGATVGTATLRINAEAIWAYLTNARISPRAVATLVDEDGVIIGPGRPELLWHSLGQLSAEAQNNTRARFNLERVESLGIGEVAAALKATQAALASGSGQVTGNVGFNYSLQKGRGAEPTVAGYGLLVSRRWAVVIMQPEGEFLVPILSAATDALPTVAATAMLVVALVTAAVSYSIKRQFQVPAKEMLDVMDQVRDGTLTARVPVGGEDELGRLGGRLNDTLDTLTDLVQTREERDSLQLRIQQLLSEVSSVAEGDLTIEAEVTADVTGALADAFNFMTDELRKIVTSIDSTTGQVSVSAGQVLVASQELATRSVAQASRIEEVSSAVQQMASSIEDVSSNATRSTSVAGMAMGTADQGGRAVSQVVEAMSRIRANTHETSQKIKRLGETSQRVGEIVQLIEDVADQTNLLALNAAIEAASAGEHGRGFAVVAEEVRRLAERSADATKQIDRMINAIQTDTSAAIVAMEESTQQVVTGSRLADDAGRSLEQIQQVVSELATLIGAISESARQHAQASALVVESMREVSSVTHQNTEGTQQTAERVSYLARLAEQLRASVAAFRLPTSAVALGR